MTSDEFDGGGQAILGLATDLPLGAADVGDERSLREMLTYGLQGLEYVFDGSGKNNKVDVRSAVQVRTVFVDRSQLTGPFQARRVPSYASDIHASIASLESHAERPAYEPDSVNGHSAERQDVIRHWSFVIGHWSLVVRSK